MESETQTEKRRERHRLSTEPIYRRDGSVKITKPTARDQQYLWPVLERYQVLPVDYIHALMREEGGNLKALRRHMMQLCAEPNPYLKRHKSQFHNGAFRSRRLCYSLEETRLSRNFWHQLLSNMIMAQIELGAGAEGLDYVTFDQILASAPEKTRFAKHPQTLEFTYTTTAGTQRAVKITPDWTPFALGRNGIYKFYFGIEADCHSEDLTGDRWNRASIEKKFREYLAVNDLNLAQEIYGLPNGAKFFFPFVTDLPSRVKSMQRILLDVTDGKGSPYFLFWHFPSYDDPVEPPRPDGALISLTAS